MLPATAFVAMFPPRPARSASGGWTKRVRAGSPLTVHVSRRTPQSLTYGVRRFWPSRVNETFIEWSSSDAPLPVSGADALVLHLSSLHSGATRPLIVNIPVGRYSLQVGLGSPDCFVHITHDDGYSVTHGDDSADGVTEYFLLGTHHTEIQRIHAIPFAVASAAAAEFYSSQTYLDSVQWEHII